MAKRDMQSEFMFTLEVVHEVAADDFIPLLKLRFTEERTCWTYEPRAKKPVPQHDCYVLNLL